MTRPSLITLSESLRALLAERPATFVLTGAGVSQESGVPTFRGDAGLWREHRPEDLATPEAFARNPRLVWEWYRWRRGLVAASRPNAGHRALAEMEDLIPEFLIATQNVDGLHQRAGSRRLVELHGNLFRTRCDACGRLLDEREAAGAEAGDLPRCACGALGRPDVVWFGEALPPAAFQRAASASRAARLVLVAGTSAIVQPAASLAQIGKSSGARLVVVNPDRTPLDALADERIVATAATALPLLAAAAAGASSAERATPRPPRA